MTTKFETVLAKQTAVFLSAIDADKKTEQTKMLAVFTTAQAMTKGVFQGIFAEDGKKVGASHPLYTFGQILSYCQRFVDAGKKDLLISELKQADGSFIGLRKAKEFLPALGRDNGMMEQFKPRATSASHKAKTDKAEKQDDNVKTLSLGDLNAEVLNTLSLDELVALSIAVKKAIVTKAMEDDVTPQTKKPTASKKQAAA